MILFAKKLTFIISSLAGITSLILTLWNAFTDLRNQLNFVASDEYVFLFICAIKNGFRTFLISLIISFPLLYAIERRMAYQFTKRNYTRMMDYE